MDRLLSVKTSEDILPQYRGTPVETLFGYHNLKMPFGDYTDSKMLIGMCMDKRIHLNIPARFAFTIRTGGANLRYCAFNVSYAIAVGGVRSIVLIGHNDCGMVNLYSKKEQIVRGLVEGGGMDPEQSEDHFRNYAPMFEIDSETEFLLSEAARLRKKYPNIMVAPLFYLLEDNMLYFIEEKSSST